MFNPQQSKNYSIQKQDLQRVGSVGINQSIQNGNNQILIDSLIRNGLSQFNSPRIDENSQNRVSNVLSNNQQKVFNSKQQHIHDKKVLNQSLQMMLSMNNAYKLNNSQIKSPHNNAYNDSSSHMNQPNNQIQQNINPNARNNKLDLELYDHKTFSYFFRKIHICLVIIYSIAAVVVTGILISYFPQSSTYRDELRMIIDNWNIEMIEDIELFVLTQEDIKNKTSPQCPDRYENFFTVYGQNTINGCNCKQSNYQQKEIFQQLCNSSQKNAGCTDIQGIVSPVGFNWETPDGKQIFNICIKRIKGLTYSSNGSQTTCEKQCGGSTEETKFCVQQNQPCPINYLYFGKDQENVTIPDLKRRQVGDYSIYYSSNGPGAPIVETRVSKGNGICYTNNIQNLYSSSIIHPLLDTSQNKVCTQTDDRFNKLMTLNEQQVYKDNYFDSIYSQIPDYQLSQTELYAVYTRTFIPIAGSRRNNDIDILNKSDSEYDRIYDSCVAALVTSVFYLIFVGMIYSTCSLLNILSKKYLFKQYLYEITPVQVSNKSSIFKRLWIKILFSLIHLISILVAFIITLQNYLYLRTLNQGTVGDKYTVQLIGSLKNEYFEQILWYVVSNFVYFACLMILEIFILVPLCSKKLKENTETQISKKYLPQTGQNGQNQQNNNNQVLELPEYQTHNIYGGNGINTTIHPFMQQMSILGIDMSVINNNRSHINSLSVRNNKNNILQNLKQHNSNLNTSDANQSLIQQEIKNVTSVPYNNTQNRNIDYNDEKYKSLLINNNHNDQSQFQKTTHDMQQNSITSRTIENISQKQQTTYPPSPNLQPKKQNVQSQQNILNMQQIKINVVQNTLQNISNTQQNKQNTKYNVSNFQQNKQNYKNNENQYQNIANIENNLPNKQYNMKNDIYHNNKEYQENQFDNQNKSIYNVSPSPIPNQTQNNTYSQYQIGDDSFFNQMTGLDMYSNEQALQYQPRTSHFKDEIQYTQQNQNSQMGNDQKNQYNEKQYQKKFSIDTLQDYGKNENDQRRLNPEEDFNKNLMNRYLNHEMTQENLKSKNMNRSNYNNNLNDKLGMNMEKNDTNNKKYNEQFHFQAVKSQNYIPNQEIGNNFNRNITMESNFDNNEGYKNINQNKIDEHLNDMYKASQMNSNKIINQQPQFLNQQNQQYNDLTSLRNTNENKHLNSHNIYNDPELLQQIHKAQSRVKDKNDQDVEDPDKIDLDKNII